MPFINQQLLEKQLGQDQIQAFATAYENVIEDLISQADAIITRHTGKQPPADPAAATADMQLRMYAAWIVHFLMMPHQGVNDREERLQRERNYDRALRELADYDDVTIDGDYAATDAAYASTKRVGDMP